VDPSAWLKQLKALHEQAKSSSLNAEQSRDYLAMREELARSLCAAQQLTVPEGASARQTFRVAHAFQVEVNNLHRTLTKDISRNGFSCLMANAFKEGDEVPFSLVVKRGEEPLTGVAQVASVVRTGSNARVGFKFTAFPAERQERLEVALFDAVLSRF
jgi:hypothetical protein